MPCTKSMSQGSEDLDWTKNLCLSNLTGTGITLKGRLQEEKNEIKWEKLPSGGAFLCFT